MSVLAWLVVFEVVNRFPWENEFAAAKPWLFPAILLPFSLLVGLLVTYRHPLTTLESR